MLAYLPIFAYAVRDASMIFGVKLRSYWICHAMVTGERNRTLVPIDTYPHGYRRKEQDSRPNRHLTPWLQEKGTGLSSQSTPTPMVTGERNRTLVPIDTYPHGYRRKEQDSRPNRHLPPWLQEKGTGLSSQSTPTPMVTGERNRTLVPIDTYPHGYRRKEQDSRPNRHLPPWLQEKGTGLSSQSTPTPMVTGERNRTLVPIDTYPHGYRRKEQDSRPNRHLPPWLQEKGTGLSSQSTPTPMVTGERNRTLVPIDTYPHGYRRKEQDSRPNRHLPPWLQEKGTGLSSQSTPTPMVTGERNRTLVPIDTYPHGYRRKEQDSRPNRHLPPWLQEKGTGLSSQSTPTPMVTGERNRTLVPIDTYPHGYRRKEQDSRPNRHLPPWLQEKGTGLSSQSTPTPMVTGERNRTLVPIDTYPHGYRRKEQDSRPNRHLPPWLQEKGTGLSSQSTPTPLFLEDKLHTLGTPLPWVLLRPSNAKYRAEGGETGPMV